MAMHRSILSIFFILCLAQHNATADINSANAALARGDYAAASAEFLRLANNGDARAQAHLGYMYYAGEGLEQSYEEAVKWYRKAAVQGDRDAQYNLAVAYAFGEGTRQDYKESATWYRRAAEQGHAIAQYSLGISYSYGEGVKQDSQEAVKWFRKSAEQGYARSQVQLAAKYHTGDGVALDYQEAVNWYRKAADKGDAAAQYNLGSMYRSGKGVKQDYNQSLRWYRLAADQGYAAATNELASLERAIAGAQRSRSKPDLQPAPQTAKTETPPARKPLVEIEKSDLLTLENAAEAEDTTEMAMAASEVDVDSVDTTDAAEDDYSEPAVEEKKPGRISGFFKKFFKKDKPEEEMVEAVEAEENITEMAVQEEAATELETSEYAAVTAEEEAVEVVDASTTMADTAMGGEIAVERGEVVNELPEKKSRFGFFKKLFGKKEPAEEASVEDHSLAEAADDAMEVETSAEESVAVAYDTAEDEMSNAETMALKEIDSASDSDMITDEQVMVDEPVEEMEEAPKKKGFFNRLFGKKDKEINEGPEVMEASDEMEPQTVAMLDEAEEDLVVAEDEISIDSRAEEEAAMDALESREAEPKKKKGFFGRLFGKKDKEAEEVEEQEMVDSDETEDEQSSEPEFVAEPESLAAARQLLDSGDYDAAYNSYYDLATAGDAEAQYQLGLLYYQGLGIRQNYNEASYWYAEAGKKGHSDAQYSLGNMYLMGEGVNQDDSEAIKWYEKAADQGHVAAAHNVSNLKRVTAASSSVPEEIEAALADEQLDADVGEMAEIEDEPPEKKKGFFKRLFGKDDEVEEMEEEAVAEVQGPLPQIQPSDEVEEIEEVAEFEEPEEKKKGFFGRLFGKKDEPEEVMEESVEASETAMVESDASAQLPAEPEQSFEEAISSLKEYEQGLAYSFGDGVPQNDQLAFESFLRSAEMGHVPAQYKTGVAYAYGEGVEKNPEQALYWYRKAAEKGYALAQRNLGVMYMNGDGIEQNKPLAFAWQSILAESGNVMDVHRRDALQQQLSEDEIEEAMALKSTLKH